LWQVEAPFSATFLLAIRFTMKRIALCFDGTWNKPADESLPAANRVETNVSRFYDSIRDVAADGVKQVKWYDQGVGTHFYDRFIGATLGTGLELNILEGYKFLAESYQDGDHVHILGFSRGAYTARSLVGMVRNCGLIHPEHLAFRAPIAYGIYRTRDDGPDSVVATNFRRTFAREVRVHFVGVWDTVGTLGIPIQAAIGLNAEFYEFHDTQLSSLVDNAFHAIAIDEHRRPYDVCLWDPKQKPGQTIEQRWFVGAHCDVGGGYADRGLSDMTLQWMQEKASGCGLDVRLVSSAPAAYLAKYSDSFAQFLSGVWKRNHERYLRTVGATRFGNEIVDESVARRRREDPTYVPRNPGLPA
jgi:uncharacterized protein (DUF2235 family)